MRDVLQQLGQDEADAITQRRCFAMPCVQSGELVQSGLSPRSENEEHAGDVVPLASD